MKALEIIGEVALEHPVHTSVLVLGALATLWLL